VNLEEKLFEAAGRMDGLEMVDLLKEASIHGLTRVEGEKILERVYNRLCDAGTEEQQDLASDVWDITRNYCHRDYRIWPKQ